MRLILIALLAVSTAACAQQQPTMSASTPPTATDSLTPQQIERMRKELEDWPNLARYRADNVTLGEPALGEQRVVFLGDSITDYWGRKRGKFFPGKSYVNRGISGQTTPQMLDRFQQDVLHLHPAVVVILGGINDIAGNTGPEPLSAIEDNFRSMVALAKSAHVRVVLCSVLPASFFPWRAGLAPAEDVRSLNRWLESFAGQENLIFLNYYSALVNDAGGLKPELASDKAVHPNDAGYAIMEPLAERAIEAALASPRP